MQVESIQALEEGLGNLNALFINRDEERDSFLCNPTIWECDTAQGKIYEMFGGIVNAELQRVIPLLFSAFTSHETIYDDPLQMDAVFPEDCNAFTGFEFTHTQIQVDRRVFNETTYIVFITNCLKYGVIKDINEMRRNLLIIYPTFVFSDRSIAEIYHWKNFGEGLYRRLFNLFDDIPDHPFMGGIGETEVLRHMNGVASKKLNQPNRVTYKLEGDIITILACRGHYD